MNNLNLLAIEGVQGAGKSTLGHLLAERGVADYPELISLIKRPRQFEQKDGGAGLSLMTDLMWFTSAVSVASFAPNDIPIILDRFILSQWVYGSLRGIKGFGEIKILRNILANFTHGWCWTIIHDILQRTIGQQNRMPIDNVNLVYLLLLPSRDLVKERRRLSGSGYTWSALQELFQYHMAVEVLQEQGIQYIVLNGTEKIEEVEKIINATFLSLSS